MSLNERMRERMEELGWEPIDLTVEMHKCGYRANWAVVNSWFNRKPRPSTPSADVVPFIAKALGLTPNDLYGFTEPAPVAAEA